MRIGRSSLVVLGIIFAVLVAFSCGDDDGDDGAYTEGVFGTPYPFNEKATFPFRKLADFRFYLEKDLSISKAEELKEVFISSIEANEGDPQQYNYAINAVGGDIVVAVWSQDASDRLSKILNDEKICIPTETPRSASGGITTENIMINLPEKVGESPCRLRVGGELLDALSKHFMLAQGPKEGQISKYDEDKWLESEVAYAGEIVVDVDKCTFTVNGDSGTYIPLRDNEIYNQRLAVYFHAVLGVAPTEVNDVVQDLDTLNTKIPLDVCPE